MSLNLSSLSLLLSSLCLSLLHLLIPSLGQVLPEVSSYLKFIFPHHCQVLAHRVTFNHLKKINTKNITWMYYTSWTQIYIQVHVFFATTIWVLSRCTCCLCSHRWSRLWAKRLDEAEYWSEEWGNSLCSSQQAIISDLCVCLFKQAVPVTVCDENGSSTTQQRPDQCLWEENNCFMECSE